MIKIGITGQEGFIGKHLYNTIGLYPQEFERVNFERSFFENDAALAGFVSQCDVVIHLAAMNRHSDPEMIYNTNIDLVSKLIGALEITNSIAHVIFSSSSQEEKENVYGKSKKRGRELLMNWAEKSNGKFTGMVIPNVFGPFGHPYYNSFIATFSYQLTHNEQPRIDVDGDVKLIYVNDLVKIIIKEARLATGQNLIVVPHTDEHKVSRILMLLQKYKNTYFDSGIIPEFETAFELNLFNTFRCYMDIENHFPVKFTQHVDARGKFVEVIRLNTGGQISFSTTVAGITRGNHFHTRKIERFAVIKGKALIQLRKIGTTETLNFYLSGDESGCVDMPIWYTHNITNIGDDELYTIFWINEFFDQNDPDTYFENV